MPTFKHFSRKGYSLFAWLGIEHRIGVLGVATLCSAAPRLAAQSLRPVDDGVRAEAAQDDSNRLGEAVVAASRAPMAADVAARQVTALTRPDLEAAGVATINDVLKLTAGIDVRQRGSFGFQTDISIDGGTFDQITILINGVPINNPQTGHNAAEFPLNLSDIERIEILEGAAARVFGSQAFSGAINVVTRHDVRPFEASAATGSYGTVQAAARTSHMVGTKSDFALSGSWQRSDGAVDNGDFSGGKLFWQGRYDDAALRLEALAGISVSDFGANTFYSAAYPNQWEATRRYFVAVKGETKGRVRFAPQVSWLRNVDHYQLIRDTPTGENFHRGDVYSATLNAWTEWRLGRTAVGAEVREEGIYSTSLGREMDIAMRFPVRGRPDILYTRRDNRTNVSYFLEHNAVVGRWTFSAGVMAQRNTAAQRGFRLYPGVDVSWRAGMGWRLFASWNRSLRLPTFTDLWYKSETLEGNVGLRAEECASFRLGADFSNRFLSVGAKAYCDRGNDMIDWVILTADDKFRATSFRLNNLGAGVTAALRFDRLLGTRQPLSRLTVAYARVYQHRRDDRPYFKSNYALEYLRDKFVATLSHRLVSRLSADWSLRVQHREGAYIVYDGTTATQALRPYGTYALLDGKVRWQTTRYELYADLTNLTACRYFDIGNVRQPGFMLMAGAKVRL